MALTEKTLRSSDTRYANVDVNDGPFPEIFHLSLLSKHEYFMHVYSANESRDSSRSFMQRF